MAQASTLPGTLRIGKDLHIYEKTKSGWKKSKETIPGIAEITHIFKANHNFQKLIDEKDSRFLKGQLAPNGQIQGARISILPNGVKLEKPYPLFAKNLQFHDQSSNGHWDVLYENPGGGLVHIYTIEKRKAATKSKYLTVKEFAQHYNKLETHVLRALKDPEDIVAVPMYTLLKTYMRVGNETYYEANGHKGLTTLTKQDITIKGTHVTFNYLAKSGVPQVITEQFPTEYVKRLKSKLQKLKNSDFVFTNATGAPLKDTQFMQAFERYCGYRFYPHIVRSHYATECVKEFLAHHKSATKEQVNQLFSSIAERLGHKRFSKKDNEWKDSYTVTMHYYIQPELVEKITSLTSEHQ